MMSRQLLLITLRDGNNSAFSRYSNSDYFCLSNQPTEGSKGFLVEAELGFDRVLGSSPGVGDFSSEYPRGRVLSSRWFPPLQ
jgi:hypothetical protein